MTWRYFMEKGEQSTKSLFFFGLDDQKNPFITNIKTY